MSFSFLLLCTWNCFFSLFVAVCHSYQAQPRSAKASLHCGKNGHRNGEEEATEAFRRADRFIAIIIK